MKVTLLGNYETENIAALGAAICVGKENDSTIEANKGFVKAVQSGHWSILEHLPLTFLIEGVSRSLTHQLVRHRIASYSQQSQRYCKIDVNNDDWYVVPIQSLTGKDLDCYRAIMRDIASIYTKLLNSGVKPEDARYVLPNACKTTILVTMNARSFIEQCNKRICMKAQWEIREMYNLMKEAIKRIYPTVYKYTNAPCSQGRCIENKPCTPNRDRFNTKI